MTRASERSIRAVPASIIIALVICASLQYVVQKNLSDLRADARSLPPPPSIEFATLASLDSPIFAAQLIMLRLQSFDVQPGISLSFKSLDYERVIAWLAVILKLNPDGQYPLLSAVRVYGEVQDPARQRRILNFVRDEFEKDPTHRWPWLAHAVYVAKHRLKDNAYALLLAEQLAAHQDNSSIPSWARQMNIFVLEDMGELESAKVLLGGLLDSGKITDPHEQWFLSNRLAELEQQISEQTKAKNKR
ncbi:MAG: hypothetical protein AAF387_00475 [Pseudomonadota bacterium]